MGGNPNHNHNRPRLGNIINRVFESAGPDGKVRGTPQQIIDKYQALARDAQLAGDRVAAESFLQHAEHYSRMLGEAQQDVRPPFEREDDRRDDGFREDGRREETPRPDVQPEQPRPRDHQPEQPRPRDVQPDQPRPPRPEGQPQRRPEPQPVIASSLTTIDPEEDGDFAGLIDTPESAASAAPRPEPAPVLTGGANGAAHPAAEAGPAAVAPPEDAPRPAPTRGRPRRKAPRPDGEAVDPAAAE